MNDEVIGFVNIKDDPLYQKGRASVLAEINKLRRVCAEAYQLAGAFGASEEALDNLSAAANGNPLPHETFLPVFASDNFSGEVQEQARIIGMSGEREARLLARVSELEREITRLRQQVSALTEKRDAAMEALVLAKVQGAKTDRDAIIDNALDYINAIQPAEVKG